MSFSSADSACLFIKTEFISRAQGRCINGSAVGEEGLKWGQNDLRDVNRTFGWASPKPGGRNSPPDRSEKTLQMPVSPTTSTEDSAQLRWRLFSTIRIASRHSSPCRGIAEYYVPRMLAP